MWRLVKPLYGSVAILMLIVSCAVWRYAGAQEIPRMPSKPAVGEKTLPQAGKKKTIKPVGATTSTPKRVLTFKNVPSTTARTNGFKANRGFGSESDYSQPGYVGDHQFVTKPPKGVVPVLRGAIGKKPPKCGALHILDAGVTARVKSCALAPRNAYAGLCRTNYATLRTQCQKLCAANNACRHWQLRPHLYEEWGCLESPPGAGVKLVPKQYCHTYEGCVCTSTLS